ncbi:hypothetical protein AB0E64_39255 [Streptomyces caelestis]|uniref:Uncharacterized protein n=1 Tax=Streptomyces caelestis TaxID=36816 RepID=A0A7W9LXU7_9ACTN|nr:hypothetical protein [Streptomyces caelestis]MBB5800114.1 hypothetical protein [Streptomyces caelestis]GGW86655.1 hypothetical protein GCM10010320_80300 [Streptomyces caelestis]
MVWQRATALGASGSGREDRRQEGTTEVDGQQAITLTREQAGVTDRWHVATEGQPYILKSSRSGGALPGETTLDYNKPVDAKAPPAADVVDVNKGRRGGPCVG